MKFLWGDSYRGEGYATINGVKYESNATVEVSEGTEIAVYLYISRSSPGITMNGTSVMDETGTYTFALAGNCTMSFDHVSGYRSNVCEITMQ